MIRAAILVLSILAIGACGPGTGQGVDAPRPAAEADYPALRWVPRDAGFVIAGTRVSDVVALSRELVTPIALAQGVSFQAMADAWRQELGVDPFDASGLVDAGIDLDRSVAVFGDLFAQTLIAPVADPVRLATFLDGRRPERDVGVSQHRGREIYTWHGQGKVAWVVLDGWLLVHRAATDDGGHAWLEEVLDAARQPGVAGEPDFVAALSRSVAILGSDRGARPAVVGVVRASVAADVARLDDEQATACTAAVTPHVRGVAFAATSGWDFGDGFVEVELSPAARDLLSGKLGPGAPAGLRALRDRAGLFATLTLDVDWLVARFSGPCLGGGQGLVNQARQAGWVPPPTAYHMVAAKLDLDEPAGQLALHLSIRDRSFVDRHLDAIPMRSLIDRKTQLAGTPVRALGVPGYPKLFYRLTGDVLSAAVGEAWMKSLLAPAASPEPDEPREIAAVGMRPALVGDLEGVAALVSQFVFPYRDPQAATEMTRLLRRYDRASLRLLLDGSRLRLRGTMQLRR